MSALSPKPTRQCPGIRKHLVIFLAQMRGFSAARPLVVEVEGSATENLAQPVPPRNTEDPWEIKKPGYDHCILPISIPTLYQCHPEPTGLSSLVFCTFPEYVTCSHILGLGFFNYPHPLFFFSVSFWINYICIHFLITG